MRGTEFQPPLDADGFSPRECPRCGSEFRVRWGRRDGRALATALSARLDHLNPGEAGAPVLRHCPYCAATAAAEAWWTSEQRLWFEHQVSDLGRELRWRRMRLPLDTLGENPNLTYVPVAPAPANAVAPLLEDDRQIAVPLPCCGEEVKVSDRWVGPVWCHFCGYVHARNATRDAWREFAQLRDWVG